MGIFRFMEISSNIGVYSSFNHAGRYHIDLFVIPTQGTYLLLMRQSHGKDGKSLYSQVS
jgi:hypothetical protein